MTYSIKELICTNCKEKFQGYLEGVFCVFNEYSTTCPQCKEQTVFKCNGSFIDIRISNGAVKIMHK